MEAVRALGSLIEAPAPEHARIAAALGLPALPAPAVHASVVEHQRYPYASVYLGAEGMMGGEPRDRIAGFRRALGVDGGRPAGRARDSAAAPGDFDCDHLASLLALASGLDQWRGEERDPARAALLEEARTTLMWEHVASWLGPYLASFERCGVAFYAAWASLLGEAIGEMAEGMALPAYLPEALREAPPAADPRAEGGAAFVSSLLAPVRSGVILVRDDLERLGAETGMACRAGERRYALRSFFAQDPGATLRWLARRAREWGEAVAGRGPEPVARWWSRRAGETAALLDELAEAAARGGASRPDDAPVSVPAAP